jgi:UPF0042 nucleotide-binding protein
MSASQAHVVFVSGLSGSGKTTAMAALEDLSFYCVDNLPAQLVPQFLDLCAKATPPIEHVALAVDAREEPFLRSFPVMVADLRKRGGQVDGIFLDCSNDVLINRYSETRRVHPLSPEGSVEEGIERERRLLREVAGISNFQIDTSVLNVHQLKETVMQLVSGRARATVVNVISFGFRHGPPQTAELLFDLRFLPNPYFDDALRDRTGMDVEVAEYVLKSAQGQAFFERLADFVEYLLPLYDGEGKAYVTIGVGCTGGRHRSVAFAQALALRLRERRREVNVEHRDVERRQ